MQTKVWLGRASWFGILLWISFGFDETACTNRHSWNRHFIWYTTPSLRETVHEYTPLPGYWWNSQCIPPLCLTCRTSHLNESEWITLTCGHFRSLNCGTISVSDEDVSIIISSHAWLIEVWGNQTQILHTQEFVVSELLQPPPISLSPAVQQVSGVLSFKLFWSPP